MNIIKESLWVGTDASLETALSAHIYCLEHLSEGRQFLQDHAYTVALNSDFLDNEEDYQPFYDIIDSDGNVGIVNITGSLVAEDSWVNSLFGLVSYESISKAVLFLNDLPEISKIVLNIDSGGGTASGIEGAGEIIRDVANGGKELISHVNGAALSAGYWLASSASKINSTKMSESGSIGVILTHKTVVRALKESGIDPTVLTAGKFKGIGHPMKELTDSDIAYLQSKADRLYDFFVEAVSSNRPNLSVATKEMWAEGKVFFADEALQVGLIDSISSTTEFFETIVDKNTVQANNSAVTYHQETVMPKAVLKDRASKAALEAGAPLEALEHSEVSAEDDAQTGDKATPVEDSGQDTSMSEDVQTEEQTQEQSASNSDLAATDSTLSKLLELTQENAIMKSKMEDLESQRVSLESDMKALKGIAIEAVHKMQIALGAEPTELSELPAATIVAQHSKVKSSFDSHFRVGQVSKPIAKNEDEELTDAMKLGIVPKAH